MKLLIFIGGVWLCTWGDAVPKAKQSSRTSLLSAEPGLQPSRVLLTRGILQHQSRLSCAGKWELTKHVSHPLLFPHILAKLWEFLFQTYEF